MTLHRLTLKGKLWGKENPVNICSYCGQANDAQSANCAGCGQALGTTTVAIAVAPSDIPPLQEVSLSSPGWSEKHLRIWEVVMVCSVAFGGSVLMSLFAFFGHRISGDWGESGVKWMYALLQEVIALGLLSFVLARRGKGLSYLGLQWSWKQAAIAPLLWFGSFVAYSIWNPVLTWCWQWQTWHPERVLFTEGISYTTFLFQFINPIFEELIVRAYLMTEVKSLTGSTTLAVVLSVLLQTSYHFYQGGLLALSLGIVFLIFSLYYARTNRILAPMVAHMIFGVSATWFYFVRGG